MAVTLKQISEYLNNLKWKHEIQADEDVILTGMNTDNIQTLILISIKENGEYFEMLAPCIVANVLESPYKEAIFQTILSISWETKFVQWEYDVSDGEIRAIIEFPLEDSTLTQRQFSRCFHGMMQVLDNAVPRLEHVMTTGHDPGDPELDELLLLQIQQQMPGLLNRLERAIENRKRRGAFPKLP
jgi:hypothetical protein